MPLGRHVNAPIRLGINNEPYISDVEAGIDRIIALIKTKRLFVFNHCRGVIDQLGIYSREIDDNGMTTEKIKDKEQYHFMDALRYCVIGLAPAVATSANPFYD